MEEYEVLATLSDEEVELILEINAEKEAAKTMINTIHERLAQATAAEQKLFGEIRSKYDIPEGVIHFNLKTKSIRKGVWREQ